MRLKFGNKKGEEDTEDPDRKYKDEDEEHNTGRGASRKGKGKGRGRGRGRARGNREGSGKQDQETTPATTTQEVPSNNAEVHNDEAPADKPNDIEQLAKDRVDNDVLTAGIEKHQGGNEEGEEPTQTPKKRKRAPRMRATPKRRGTPKKRATPKRKRKTEKTTKDSQKDEKDKEGEEEANKEGEDEANKEGEDAPNELTPRTKKKKDNHEPRMHHEFVTARLNCSTFNSLMCAASEKVNDILFM